MSSQVRLTLLPSARGLFDEPVQVKVAGLRSRQVVTMRARSTDERGETFSSSATYRADGGGEIDLLRDPSLSGSYVGVEPMGLLWAMRADTGLHKYFYKNKALKPHMVKLSVHEEEGEGRMLAEATNERFLMREGVSRLPIKQGNFQGVLFTPPALVEHMDLFFVEISVFDLQKMVHSSNGNTITVKMSTAEHLLILGKKYWSEGGKSGEGLFPAVLDLCTFMSEKRACLLANKGFVVLAVAVLTDKPDNVKEMHLDHFEEAVDFLQQHPKVGSKGVGVISRSKGGDVALSLAAFVPGVEAVVWINGCSANVGAPLYYKKRQILTSIRVDPSKVSLTASGARLIKYAVGDPHAEENKGSLVPIERATGHFLFVASEDDLNWDSKAYMDGMVERLKRHGKDNFECVFYPRAGHLLEPPYGPFCPSALHGLLSFPVVWGGEPGVHAAAEVHLWKKIQEFLRTHLSCDNAQSTAKL